MLNRSPRNSILPLVLSFGLLVIYAVPNMKTSGAGQMQVMMSEGSANAVTMQMMKTEGDVNITNDRGKKVSFLEKMQLYSGYHVETQEKSYAWINLDSSKLTKLDALSEIEVRKSGGGFRTPFKVRQPFLQCHRTPCG